MFIQNTIIENTNLKLKEKALLYYIMTVSAFRDTCKPRMRFTKDMTPYHTVTLLYDEMAQYLEYNNVATRNTIRTLRSFLDTLQECGYINYQDRKDKAEITLKKSPNRLDTFDIRENYIKIPLKVLREIPVKCLPLIVSIEYCKGKTDITQYKLANLCSCSEGTLRKNLKRCIELGMIETNSLKEYNFIYF